MIKRIVFIIMLALIMTFSFGCGANEEKDLEDMDIFEIVHEMAKDQYEWTETDYDLLPEDEYRIRAVVEATDIFWDNKDGYQEQDEGAKYGILNYWRGDNYIGFDSLEDMETVISNQDFRNDFQILFGIKFEPDAYYLLEDFLESGHINLYVIDNNYYLNINNMIHGETFQDFVSWGVFDTMQDIDPKETAQLYADLCGAELHTETLPDGNTVYYYSGKRSKLVEAMGIGTNDTTTAYIWGQDGVLGVVVMPGEHKDENFEWCKLEKHEL